MDTLAITNQSDNVEIDIMAPSNNTPQITTEGTVNEKVKKGQVVQKGYVLNDTGALKKKLRQESRKEPFNLGVEARDGSNMVIEMKTSFFEHVKNNFVNDLMKTDGIESVENGVAAKAPTESSGTAFVEFSLDIAFKVFDKVFMTKLTAYTTSCRIMFQPVGTTPQMKALLGNRSVPRYFVDNYFLPWCENAQTNKNYDEKQLLDDIREEIKRLDMIKFEAKKARKEGRLTSVSSPEVKCVAKGCKYTGLNSNNKSAVGICAKCGGFEHFECSKTKQETRDDIQKGELQYFCSVCFLKNPSSIAFETSKPAKKQISPALGIIQVTPKTKALPAPTTLPLDPKIVYKCPNCKFEAETNDLLKKHEEENHKFRCEDCSDVFPSSLEKESHILNAHQESAYECDKCKARFQVESELKKHKQDHIMENSTTTYSCTICTENFTCLEDQQIHIKQGHSSKCPLCPLTFTDNAVFLVHLRNEHAPYCELCKETFTSRNELEDHIENKHGVQDLPECSTCGGNFQDQTKLDEHILSQHSQCTSCEDILVNEEELQIHMEAKHKIKCSICDTTTKTDKQMNEHMSSMHGIACPICGSRFRTPQEFSQHFQDQHILRCETCDKEVGNQKDLENHMQLEHTNVCTACDEIFPTAIQLSAHTKEKHSFICTICVKTFIGRKELQDHTLNHHSFDCDKCDYKGTTAEIMEQHILEKHIEPGDNNEFSCDDCNFVSKDKGELYKHFKETHNPDEPANITDANNEEVSKLKEDLKILKNNFQRLESLLQDALEENNKMKSEHESKLVEANDKLRIVTTENEELKEKVDVLFKLGRGYINKHERKEHTTPATSAGNNNDIQTVSVEEITVEEDDNVTNEDLQEWTRNKLRGFKRSAPTARAEKNSSNQSFNNYIAKDSNNSQQKSNPSETIPTIENNSKSGRPRYCHYFANLGKCVFEERTGGTCRFSHEEAPMCQRGSSCSRNKCMYKHPNMAGRRGSPFLDQRSGMPQNMNPWMMINPWWNPSQAHVQVPWNTNTTRATFS